jgi:hypothetical protein
MEKFVEGGENKYGNFKATFLFKKIYSIEF